MRKRPNRYCTRKITAGVNEYAERIESGKVLFEDKKDTTYTKLIALMREFHSIPKDDKSKEQFKKFDSLFTAYNITHTKLLLKNFDAAVSTYRQAALDKSYTLSGDDDTLYVAAKKFEDSYLNISQEFKMPEMETFFDENNKRFRAANQPVDVLDKYMNAVQKYDKSVSTGSPNLLGDADATYWRARNSELAF